MAGFGIQTRNASRDVETDTGRLDRLCDTLSQLQNEIVNERAGLRGRFEQAQTSAAYALDAVENGERASLSDEADALGVQMKRYQDRLTALIERERFLQEMAKTVRDYKETIVST